MLTSLETRIDGCVMVFNATFNNISVILWWSVLLLEETGVPRENPKHVANHRQTSSHNVVSSTPRRTYNVNGDRLHRYFRLELSIGAQPRPPRNSIFLLYKQKMLNFLYINKDMIN